MIVKWRVTFNDECKLPITYNIVNNCTILSEESGYNSLFNYDGEIKYYKHYKFIPLIIQNYAKYYCRIIKKNFPEFEFPKRTIHSLTSDIENNTFDWCYVYLMKDISNNYYKIGMSNTPEYRERTLQSEKPTIEMICNKRYPSRKIAEAFEKALHTAYANKRVRGEWFDLDDYDVMMLTEAFK
jgi:hypothetical protein